MDYIILLMAMSASAILSIMSSLFGKYNSQAKNTSHLYSVIVTFSATITLGITCYLNEGIKLEALGYSLIYGMFYTMAMIGMFKAYQIGSVSLTAFVKQLSLICVSFWGFIFWGNPLTANIAIGIILVICALCLCFKSDKTHNQATSLAWFVFALMLLVGNAGCSISQKYQQLFFGNNGGNAFIFFGTFFAFVVSLLLYLKDFKRRPQGVSKRTMIFPIIGGVSSALLNLFILRLLSSKLSESIIFPGIAVGSLALTMLFSLIAYKERLSARTWCGLIVGIVALIFLNIA